MLRRHEDQRDLAQIQEVRDRPANEQFLAWDGLAMSLGLSGARPTYELVILPTAFLELAMLPTRPFGAVAQAIHTLSHDSHPPMAEALGSSPDAFRLLVAGYRVLYAADEEQRTVQVIDIARDQRSC
jgi:mRNA-degrading endonuclease RelE of RelBE toxin-antitoxin system